MKSMSDLKRFNPMRPISLLLVAAGLCHGAYTSLATVNFAGATSSTQTNITLLFTFSDNKLRTVANGGQIQNTVSRNGYTVPADFVFTDDTTCQTVTGSYTWGFEGDYSPTAGTGLGWVKIPSYTTGGVTPTVCIGNSAVSTYQGGAVGAEYDSNTTGVWNFPDGSSLSLTDASSGAHALTGTNTPTATAGKIDGGMAVASASGQYASNSTNLVSGAMTVEAWINGTSFPGAYNTVTGADSVSSYFDIHVKSNGKLAMYLTAGAPVSYDGTGSTLSTATWYHVAMVYDATNGLKGYLNGSLDGSNAGGGNAVSGTATVFAVGNNPPNDPTRYFNGKIDAVRVSSVARSANWIATEYGNQNSPPAVGAFSPVPVPDFSLSGPTSGKLGVASTNFTVTKTTGTFNGSNTITFTASASATFTPSVGSPSASPITVTPTNGSSSFTFTIQAAAIGTITITPTNNFSGLNPDPVNYTTGFSCLSAAAGNGNASGSWTSCGTGGVPQNGDTAAISHAITFTANQTIGTSPASGGTAAITTSGTGSVIVSEGITLTVRGDIKIAAPGSLTYVLDLQGGNLTMDPTASASPTTTAYTIGPSADIEPNAYIRTRIGGGSSTRPTVKTLRTNGNEAQSRFDLNGHNTNVGLFDFQDTDFTDMGDASNAMATTYMGAGGTLNLRRNAFTRCGLFDSSTAWPAASSVVIRDNTWTSTTASETITAYSLSAPSADRTFTGNYLDKPVHFGFWLGATVQYNIILGTWVEAAASGPTVFQYNVIDKTVQPSITLYGTMYQDFFLITTYQGSNPQGIALGNTSANQTVDGMIGQLTYTTPSDIEVVIGGGVTPARTMTVKNSITLPASDPSTGVATTYPSGNLYVGISTVPSKMEYYHNTMKGGLPANLMQPIWLNHPGISVPANSITAYKSNLYWDTSAQGNHVSYTQTPVNNDILTPSAVTNNAAYNFTASAETGSTGTAYSYPTTTAPGNHDLNSQNPGFLDTTRNFEGFATQYSLSRSVANTLAVLAVDPTTRIPLLMQWVRAGFAPSNALYFTSAHDGTTIGAVQVTPVPLGGLKSSKALFSGKALNQ